jgi:transcription initiation factor TFIIIB Brf1 subunit/transcription initiation factor TFIIB
MACVSCGSNEIEYADAKGETVCMSCGTVLEESSIVNAIGFDESASGAQYVWRETVRSAVILTTLAVCSLPALL